MAVGLRMRIRIPGSDLLYKCHEDIFLLPSVVEAIYKLDMFASAH